MAWRRAWPMVLLNGAVLLYLGLSRWWPAPLLLSAVINLLVLCVPGLAWLRLLRGWVVDRASAVLMTVALSAAAGAAALGVPIVLRLEPTSLLHVYALVILTNIGLAVTWGRPWPTTPRPMGAFAWSVLLPLAALAYLWLFIGATLFVPKVPDQDIEIQGTAYSIARNGTPMMLHDRRLPYHFAHPHLLHILSAEGLLLAGELRAVRPYYDAAVEAGRWRRASPQPGDVRLAYTASGDRPPRRLSVAVRVLAVEGDTVVLDQPILVRRADGTGALTDRPSRSAFLDVSLLHAYHRAVGRTYEVNPLFWQTRAVNLGVVLVALFFLHELAARLSRSGLVAALVPLAYLSVPEVLGRSCCAAYLAITVFLLLAAGWWYLAPVNRRRPSDRPSERSFRWPWQTAFLASGLLALANHKAVVAVAGMVAAGALADGLRGRWRLGFRCALFSPVAWGFLSGTALFWAYGLAVAPGAFITDHLLHHVVHRVAHVDALFYVRGGAYVTVGALWRRFVMDAGVALPAVALSAFVALAVRGRARDRHVVAMLAWLVAVSVAFTVIDWRQTKHLMHLMPVLVLAPAAAAGAAGRMGRLIWAGLLVLSVAAAGLLTVDWIAHGYDSFKPAGGW